jgi:hypothetical protein
MNLLGTNIAIEPGQRFAHSVLNHIREKLLCFQEQTGNNYNLEPTPAEGTSYQLARIDAEKFPGLRSVNDVANQEVVSLAPTRRPARTCAIPPRANLRDSLSTQTPPSCRYSFQTLFSWCSTFKTR